MQLSGLNQRPELNGRTGKIVGGLHDANPQKVGGDWRFTVQLDTPFVNVMSKEIKKIKLVPANLTALVDLT